MKKSEAKRQRILGPRDIKRHLERIGRQILREHRSSDSLALIGIRTRGIHLARRLCEFIQRLEDKKISLGEMDISLYRDDVNALLPEGKVDRTKIPFDITNKTIILVDDVLHTGRTVRAAVDHLIDLGRPRAIHLAVLIDRGGREFPIAANFVGKTVKVRSDGEVRVRLKEVDKKDEVVVTE